MEDQMLKELLEGLEFAEALFSAQTDRTPAETKLLGQLQAAIKSTQDILQARADAADILSGRTTFLGKIDDILRS